jgi:hypothetical protein
MDMPVEMRYVDLVHNKEEVEYFADIAIGGFPQFLAEYELDVLYSGTQFVAWVDVERQSIEYLPLQNVTRISVKISLQDSAK